MATLEGVVVPVRSCSLRKNVLAACETTLTFGTVLAGSIVQWVSASNRTALPNFKVLEIADPRHWTCKTVCVFVHIALHRRRMCEGCLACNGCERTLVLLLTPILHDLGRGEWSGVWSMRCGLWLEPCVRQGATRSSFSSTTVTNLTTNFAVEYFLMPRPRRDDAKGWCEVSRVFTVGKTHPLVTCKHCAFQWQSKDIDRVLRHLKKCKELPESLWEM